MRAIIFGVVFLAACSGNPDGTGVDQAVDALDNDCADFAAWSIPCGETFAITGEFEVRALNKGVCDPNVGAVERKTSAAPSNPKGHCPAGQDCVGNSVVIGLRNVPGKSFTVSTQSKVTCGN